MARPSRLAARTNSAPQDSDGQRTGVGRVMEPLYGEHDGQSGRLGQVGAIATVAGGSAGNHLHMPFSMG